MEYLGGLVSYYCQIWSGRGHLERGHLEQRIFVEKLKKIRTQEREDTRVLGFKVGTDL